MRLVRLALTQGELNQANVTFGNVHAGKGAKGVIIKKLIDRAAAEALAASLETRGFNAAAPCAQRGELSLVRSDCLQSITFTKPRRSRRHHVRKRVSDTAGPKQTHFTSLAGTVA